MILLMESSKPSQLGPMIVALCLRYRHRVELTLLWRTNEHSGTVYMENGTHPEIGGKSISARIPCTWTTTSSGSSPSPGALINLQHFGLSSAFTNDCLLFYNTTFNATATLILDSYKPQIRCSVACAYSLVVLRPDTWIKVLFLEMRV